MRNPGRTAATAAALMIGIALVAFVAVIGQGMKSATRGSLENSVRGNYVLVGQDNWSPIDPAVTRAAAKVPGVRVASGVEEDVARAFGKRTKVDAVDPRRSARCSAPSGSRAPTPRSPSWDGAGRWSPTSSQLSTT
jgi:putative ABC transport system permease protein